MDADLLRPRSCSRRSCVFRALAKDQMRVLTRRNWGVSISGESGFTVPLIGRDQVRMAGMLPRVPVRSARLCLAASQVLRPTSADDLA